MSYIPINKGQFTLETPEREALFEKKRGFGVEDAYKENRRQWVEYPKQQYVANYPLHVDVELSSVCNLKCPMCYTITNEFKAKVKPRLMDYDIYIKIITECAKGGVYSIRLSYRGEAFLHKKVVDCIRYAKAKGIKEVSALTNGLRLDEALFKEAMEVGMDWITISFDGLGETYEKIRRPAKFERSLEKIKNYHKIKKEAGRVKPAVKIQSIFPAIAEDPEKFYETFAPISDMVSTNPLIDYLGKDDEDNIEYIEDFICPQLYQRLVIAADGQVLMCSNDEDNGYVMGDINTQSVHDVWHGKKIEYARKIHKETSGYKKFSPCRKCYLPRRTVVENVSLGDRKVELENYTGRSQVIGE